MEIPYGEIIGWAGGSAVIISGVSAWIGQLYLSNRTEKWRFETEIKLKKLENELSQKDNIINNLVSVQKENYASSQIRRIEAIENVWKLFNEFMFSLPNSTINIHSLRLDEYDTYLDKANFDEDMDIKKDMCDMERDPSNVNIFADLRNQLVFNRPFLGEDLYYKFHVNYTFIVRNILNILQSIANNKLHHWQDDLFLLKLVRKVMSKEDYEYITKYKKSSFNYTLEVLEKQIIESMNSMLSGKLASEDSRKHLDEIRTLLAEVDSKLKIAP